MKNKLRVGDPVEPKDGYLEQFRMEDYVRPMFIGGIHESTAVANTGSWFELEDDKGNKIVGASGNTLFSENWVKKAEFPAAA